MASLKVMCGRSMHVAAGALGSAFAARSGHTVAFDFGTMGALEDRLGGGARPDVAVLAVPIVDRLERQGAAVAGSRRNVARTFIGVAVRAGEAAPDISTPEAFERALRQAQAVAFSDAAVGGSAGVYLEGLFRRLGLEELIRAKGLPQPSGVEVCRRVAEGRADLGMTLSGEIATVREVKVAGPLPPPLGHDTVYAAVVMTWSPEPEAASAFIAALAGPDAAAVWREAGFEP